MRTDEHLDVLQREGELLAAAVDGADPTAPIAHCPEWTVRDLVRHIGRIHRWVTVFVRDGRTTPITDKAERAQLIGPMPDDDALPGWYRESHSQLVDALRAAPEDLQCWTFIPAPSPLAFWTRRQAHETAIHRFDAQQPRGVPDEYPTAFAADGIDELLVDFVGGTPGSAIKADPPRALHVHATDLDRHWTVHFGPDGTRVSQQQDRADCTISGPASVLYPLLWNRLEPKAAVVDGDAKVVEFWRASVTI